jgi:DNA-binding IclR family transcriptional regulator
VICVAAAIPVHADHTVAALSVSGPASRLDTERIREYATLAVETARNVEKALVSKGRRG